MMRVAELPVDERERIEALRLLNILDTEPEERFDRLTRMARRLFDVPIATVTLIDTERQWFKSAVGLENRETSRDIALCAHAILDDAVMLVPDARQDERFSDNPLVTGAPNIRFYAGCPLKVGVHNLGTLCVIDDKPREFGSDEVEMLKDLAVMAQRELAAVQLATTDHLTGISNRRGFEQLARHALSVGKRMKREATLLMFDLNGFKQINDRFGHAEGDRALRDFAWALTNAFRESDVVGRLGGDEFAVLLTGTGVKNADAVLANLKERLRLNSEVEARGYEISYSAGRVELDAQSEEPVEALLARADAAMYERKRELRGR